MLQVRAQIETLLLCMFTLLAAGCAAAGGGGGGLPGPTPAPTLGPGPHFYTTDGAARVYVFNMPLTSSSVPVVIVNTTGAGTYNPCFDNAGHMYVTYRSIARLDVYNLPVSSSATAAYSLSLPSTAVDCHFDPNGNLYVALQNANEIAVFKAPVTSGSAVNSLISSGVSGPWGVFADGAGNVYVSNLTNQTLYSPLGSGNTLQATFGTQFDDYGIIIGPGGGDLYVSDVLGTNQINVYHAPFTNASTADPSKTILVQQNTATHCVTYISFDGANNLYTVGSDDNDATFNHIYVYAPPYTSKSLDLSTGTVKLRGATIGP